MLPAHRCYFPSHVTAHRLGLALSGLVWSPRTFGAEAAGLEQRVFPQLESFQTP